MNIFRRAFPPLGAIAALSAAALSLLSLPVATTQTEGNGVVRNTTTLDGAEIGRGPLTSAETSVAIDQSVKEVLWTRPLFAEGRQPPVKVIAAPVSEPEPIPPVVQQLAEPPEPEAVAVPPSIRMLGSMSVNGSMRALVAEENSQNEVWVEVGYVIEGWMLTKISHEALQLTHGKAEVTIKLFE